MSHLLHEVLAEDLEIVRISLGASDLFEFRSSFGNVLAAVASEGGTELVEISLRANVV